MPVFSPSATQVYESNLFSTPSDRQADSIARVTPGIQSEYRSPLSTWSGRYSLDAERFANHDELTAVDARQTGARFTGDRLSGGFEAQTHTICVNRRLSPRTAVVTSYRAGVTHAVTALTGTTIPRHTAWMRIVAAPRHRDR